MFIYEYHDTSYNFFLIYVLDKLINKDQTGFLAGRYIGENTRLLYDVMKFTEDNDIPGMILMVDFEKAFDSVSWKFIEKVLIYFGFGNSIRNWIKLFHRNVGASVNQGGNLSSFFSIKRGCRQGDPVAPYIFILCAEILAIRFRNNKNIHGIQVDDTDILVSQYADDTYLTLDGTEHSIRESISELQTFANISGLKMNTDKTEVIWIGSKKHSQDKFLPELDLQWGKETFCLLGIDFSVNLHEMVRMNFDKKIVKLKSLINTWSRRNLTPIGKIHLIKSLMISQFNHLFISLPNPDGKTIQTINSILFEFLWHSKVDKVKRETIVQDYTVGGLKMLHVANFIDSLKLSWIKRLYQSSGKWKCILIKSININRLLDIGGTFIQVSTDICDNLFWKDVLKAWGRLENSENMKTIKGKSLLLTPVWYNCNITIGGKTIFYPHWYEKGVYLIGDFVKDFSNNTLFSYEEFIQKFNINTDFLKYYAIISAIRKSLQNYNIVEYKFIRPTLPVHISIFLDINKGSKRFYGILNNIKSLVSKGREKWGEHFDFTNDDWLAIYTLPFQVTKSSKFQWLQFRISHNILTTNSFLFKVRILDSPLCTLCNAERETIVHLFWECDEVQNLLQSLDRLLDALYIPFTVNKQTILFGKIDNGTNLIYSIDNQIILLIKQYIYRTRCLHKSLSINALTCAIHDYYKVQKYITYTKGERVKDKFALGWKKWEKFIKIMND